MNVTKERYEEASKVIRGLPPWMGEGEIWSAAKVIYAVNGQNPELAKQLWWYLLASHLEPEQMVQVGGKMIAHAIHHVYCGMDRAVDASTLSDHELQIGLALDTLRDALRARSVWVMGANLNMLALGQVDASRAVGCMEVQDLFLLPWSMPEWDKADFWGLLLSACRYLGTLGVGAVGLDEEFTVVIDYPSAGHGTQLSLEFRVAVDGVNLFADIPSPDVGVAEFWVSSKGLEPVYISFRGEYITAIANHLGLTPKMSRSEIEMALNTLTFTAERP